MKIISKKYEELTLDELYEILRLRNEVFIVEQKSIYQDLDKKDRVGQHLFIKNYDEDVVACIRIIKGDKDKLYIGRFIVSKEYRGIGLGSKLMEKAIEYGFEQTDRPTIIIEAQSHLEKYYNKFGFIRNSDDYNLDGIEHLEMLLKKK